MQTLTAEQRATLLEVPYFGLTTAEMNKVKLGIAKKIGKAKKDSEKRRSAFTMCYNRGGAKQFTSKITGFYKGEKPSGAVDDIKFDIFPNDAKAGMWVNKFGGDGHFPVYANWTTDGILATVDIEGPFEYEEETPDKETFLGEINLPDMELMIGDRCFFADGSKKTSFDLAGFGSYHKIKKYISTINRRLVALEDEIDNNLAFVIKTNTQTCKVYSYSNEELVTRISIRLAENSSPLKRELVGEMLVESGSFLIVPPFNVIDG